MSNRSAWPRRAGAVAIAVVIVVGGLHADGGPTDEAAATAAVSGRRPTLTRALALSAAPSTTAAPTTTAPPPVTTAAPPPPPAPIALPLVVPTGKGMWIYQPEFAEGGDPNAIVARAVASGLTHLYVRTGSSIDGFDAAPFLDALLPVAHASGVRIIGWDFPYLDDPAADVARAAAVVGYVTPSGDRLDGFSADIETPAEKVALTAESAAAYGSMLRDAVGPAYPLIATVPRPSPQRQATYPYAEVTAAFDAIAPMVYWIDAAPDQTVAEAVDYLAAFGKPVLPVGQAYDGSMEGGPPGTPTPGDIDAFISTAKAHGAAGVSFWSWQHASDDTWSVITSAPEVGVTPPPPPRLPARAGAGAP